MARQAWVAMTVSSRQRARAYSLVAGSQRVGMLIGPLAAAVVISTTGHQLWTFLITIGAAVGVIVILFVWPTPAEPQVEVPPKGEMPGVFKTMRLHRRVLATLGAAAALLASLRAVRLILVPLWGLHLGISPVHITLLVGVCSGIDVAFFYAGGQITDRYGRMWVSVPTMLGFAVANLGLALSTVLPGEVQLYVAFAVLMSLANALSSGVNATMGADLADPRQPAVFLGSWRFIAQVGSGIVPLVFSAITAVSLALATVSMGFLAILGTFAMLRFIPRYLPQHVRPHRSGAPGKDGPEPLTGPSPG
jgi:MFS family permease